MCQEYICPNKAVRVEIALLNSGKTPARNPHESTGYVLSKGYLKEPPAEGIAKIEKILLDRPTNALPPQGRFISRMGDAEPGAPPQDLASVALLKESYEPIRSKLLMLYVFGEYQYFDVSNRSHTTKFCLYVSDPDAKELQYCEGFNEIN